MWFVPTRPMFVYFICKYDHFFGIYFSLKLLSHSVKYTDVMFPRISNNLLDCSTLKAFALPFLRYFGQKQPLMIRNSLMHLVNTVYFQYFVSLDRHVCRCGSHVVLTNRILCELIKFILRSRVKEFPQGIWQFSHLFDVWIYIVLAM